MWQAMQVRLWLIPLDHTLPALQAYLVDRNDEPLDSAEAAGVAYLLEQCVRTAEALARLGE